MNRAASSKQRADLALLAQGLAESRSQAQALILAGRVYLGEQRVDKPSETIKDGQILLVRAGERYVSRGGNKLEGALLELQLEVGAACCVDIGASTGGFSDCLLQHGAARVYAVDVGHGQLAHSLRNDARVVVREGVNARHLEASDFAEPIDLVVVDASFIGIAKLLPAIGRILPERGRLLAMIKPQFEAGPSEARKSRGVIRDEAVRQRILGEVRTQLADAGFDILAECDSRLKGPKGNLERFMLCTRRAP